MKIITLNTQGKGGTGCSATAVNLYLELSKKHKVLIIDIDENKHTTKFFLARKDGSYKLEENIDSADELEEILGSVGEHRYDYIIIDSGKYISVLNDYALQISDLIIVPTSDSGSDFIQAHQFIDKITESVINKNDYTEVKLLVNRVKYNSTKFHKEMVKNYKDIDRVSVLETIVAENSAYKNMSLSGKGVVELTKNKRAISDIESLALEVVGISNG